jgi:ABC-type bacteriocin/lantibiotic exporter with double-glycine peptidase domain
MKLLIDEGLSKRNFELFAGFAGLAVLCGVGMRVITLTYELLSQKFKNSVAESLTLRMFKSYFEIPYAEIAKSDSGYFISRMYDEPVRVAQGVVTTVMGMLASVIICMTGLAISVYLTWKVTLLLSLVVPVLYYLGNRFSPKIKAASERENEEEARLREVLGKSIECYKTVKVFGLYPSVYRRVLQHLQSYLGVLYRRFKTSKNYQTLSGIWISLAEALVIVAAGWEVVAGNLTIGGLFAFMEAFWKFIGAATGIVNQIPELSRLSGCIDRLAEFEGLARPVESRDAKYIELDNVSFRYNGKNVLDGLNLKIGAHERVLIVGPNGSGKSTLSHLMTGFLEPSEGVVMTPRLERISAMLAPFHFAPGNLKDNVDYKGLTEEKMTLFWELVRGLELEHKVEADASSELSEGEKKKCQIVMTLLKDAEIYLFDEPLANIDVGSRDAIMRAQLEHTRGKAVISIMHGDEKYHSLFDRVIALKQAAAESARA